MTEQWTEARAAKLKRLWQTLEFATPQGRADTAVGGSGAERQAVGVTAGETAQNPNTPGGSNRD